MNVPATSSPPSLIGLTPAAIGEHLTAMGEKPFRGKQIAQWLYTKRVADFDQMTDLGKELREKLKAGFALRTAKVVARDHSPTSNTTKLALRFPDGVVIESVLMIESDDDDRADAPFGEGRGRENPSPWQGEGGERSEPGEGGKRRITACISTQAGCAMGCRFCASGQLGLKRNLTSAEIIEQFYAIAAELGPDRWLTNVVYMGMGEPLHNWEGFTGSLTALTSEWGFNMSPRRITVSTVGVAKRLAELASLDIPVNLAVSLHAPDDLIREKLIPTNAAYGGVATILAAAKEYYARTKRQVTFEYTLVRDVNDGAEQAGALVKLLRDGFRDCNINLIPMNPVEGSGLKTPDEEVVRLFAGVLRNAGFSVHTRKKKGRSVNAACGQLRLRVEQGTA